MAAHGIYVERLTTGVVYGVQLEDEAKHRWSLTPLEYVAQNHLPLIETLPDIAGYLRQKSLTALTS